MGPNARTRATAAFLALSFVTRGATLTAHQDTTWAVIVDASRYWYNYRHSVNALAFYEVLKSHGVPDHNILLLLADYPASDPRNRFPGQLFFDRAVGQSVAGADVSVDIRGHAVNAASFLRILTGQNSRGSSTDLHLESTRTSRVLLYITGHGGDEFLKFSDVDELGSMELGDAIRTMGAKGRFGELLLLVCAPRACCAPTDQPLCRHN